MHIHMCSIVEWWCWVKAETKYGGNIGYFLVQGLEIEHAFYERKEGRVINEKYRNIAIIKKLVLWFDFGLS